MSTIVENITKGEWKYEGGDNNSIDIVLPDETTISIDRQSRYTGEYVIERVNMESNAQLISDAGTTANKCGKLPSELLEMNNELLADLTDIIWLMERGATYEELIERAKTSKQLIQKHTKK